MSINQMTSGVRKLAGDPDSLMLVVGVSLISAMAFALLSLIGAGVLTATL